MPKEMFCADGQSIETSSYWSFPIFSSFMAESWRIPWRLSMRSTRSWFFGDDQTRSQLAWSMARMRQNELVFIPRTGHTYQQKEQELANHLLRIALHWRAASALQ